MQAEHHQRTWPSATPFWFGTLLICLTVLLLPRWPFLGFAFCSAAVASPPSTLQNLQPLQAIPPITAEPAALGLLNSVSTRSEERRVGKECRL